MINIRRLDLEVKQDLVIVNILILYVLVVYFFFTVNLPHSYPDTELCNLFVT